MKSASSGRLVALLCSVIFCAAISIPFTAQVFRVAPPGKLAEVTTTPMPQFTWSFASARAVGKVLASGWLDKNYPFRGDLIRWYNFYSAKLFGSMSSNAPVVVGKEGWLYLAKDRSRDVLEEHRAVKPLSEDQMAKLAAIFEERKAWLAERGIKYLVMVAPNKDTIYPEHLPDEFKQVGAKSRMDQLTEYFAANTSIDLLDLRPALLKAKKHDQVFYATDSHWNAKGAFPCYQELILRLAKYFPGLKPLAASDFYMEEYTYLGGDLSYMVGIEELITENKLFMLPKRPLKAVGLSTGIFKPGYSQPAQASECRQPGLPKAVFFHDSYFWEVLGFVGENFSRAVYVWVKSGYQGPQVYFDKELVEAEKPDVVVEEIAERFFLPESENAKAGGGGQ